MARNPLGGLRRRRQPVHERMAAMPFGERTDEQIRASLEKAQEARAARSRLLTDIRNGEVTAEELLGEDQGQNERVAKLPVRTMLNALPGVTQTRARKIMDEVGIADKRRIAGLGVRQRAALLEKLSS